MSSPVVTSTVSIDSGLVKVPAYLAHPEHADNLPIVVVIQEIFGVNTHIRDVTERIAREGYIAIAPHIYHRQIPGFEVGYSSADLDVGRKYKAGTQADELLSDVQGAIDYGRDRFNAPSVAAGCIGFCFGGHVAYLAATLQDIKATASFYGAGIVDSTPGSGSPTLTRTPDIKGTLHVFFGLDDPLIPHTDIDAIETALQQSSISHRVFRYDGATHGFFCDRRASYDEDAAQDAWKHVKSLFGSELKASQ